MCSSCTEEHFLAWNTIVHEGALSYSPRELTAWEKQWTKTKCYRRTGTWVGQCSVGLAQRMTCDTFLLGDRDAARVVTKDQRSGPCQDKSSVADRNDTCYIPKARAPSSGCLTFQICCSNGALFRILQPPMRNKEAGLRKNTVPVLPGAEG